MTIRKASQYSILVAAAAMLSLPQLHAQYGPPPPPPSQDGPPPSVVGDMARHAYLDGMSAARQDLDQGLRPDPKRSSLFRHPPAPRPAWNDYRDAFGHGYQAGLDRYRRGGGPSMPPPPPPPQ